MRLEAEGAPYLADHGVADARALRHLPRAPVRLPLRLALERLDDHGLDIRVGNRARPADPRFVVETLETTLDEPRAPLPDGLIRRSMALRDRGVRRLALARAGEDETRPKCHVPVNVSPLREALQLTALIGGHDELKLLGASLGSHAPLDHGPGYF